MNLVDMGSTVIKEKLVKTVHPEHLQTQVQNAVPHVGHKKFHMKAVSAMLVQKTSLQVIM